MRHYNGYSKTSYTCPSIQASRNIFRSSQNMSLKYLRNSWRITLSDQIVNWIKGGFQSLINWAYIRHSENVLAIFWTWITYVQFTSCVQGVSYFRIFLLSLIMNYLWIFIPGIDQVLQETCWCVNPFQTPEKLWFPRFLKW